MGYQINPANGINSMLPANPGSKKESLPQNKFSYSFQPVVSPLIMPKSGPKTGAPLNLGLGYLPLPKPNSLLKKPDLFPVSNYKY